MLSRRALAAVVVLALTGATLVVWRTAPAAGALAYRSIVGSGSTWGAGAISQWTSDAWQDGLTADYVPTGAAVGRREFRQGLVDFAVSELPYGLTNAQGEYDAPPSRPYAYLPVLARETALTYNITVAGRRVTDLRLSGESVTKIFTGVIRRWNDPLLQQDNPGIALPDQAITRVVRSDTSGTTHQLSAWMASEHPLLWDAYCRSTSLDPDGGCGPVATWPQDPGTIAVAGSTGVSAYVAGSSGSGAISYVERQYTLNAKLPVAKLLNSSGFHVAPTPEAVGIALMSARIDDDASKRVTHMTQILDGVYRSTDPRSYPLSAYAYAIVPTAEGGTFTAETGRSLGRFLRYGICDGQSYLGPLGYAGLPVNLVEEGMKRLRLVPGVDAASLTLNGCSNPAIGADGTDTLSLTAPYPPTCDRAGPTQCGAGGPTSTAPPVSVLPASPEAEGLMRALAGALPGLTVAGVDRSGGTFTLPACQQGPVPLPASSRDEEAMLAGLEYRAVSGATVAPLPSACRPMAVTTTTRRAP